MANSGVAPGAYFVDPRLDRTTTVTLPDPGPQTSPEAVPAALPARYSPVPGAARHDPLNVTVSRLTGAGPVSFDMHTVGGDPDVARASPPPASPLTGTNSDSLSLSEPEVTPGLWSLVTGEVGPYPPGAPPKNSSPPRSRP